MTSDRIVGAWEEFQAHSGGFARPRTETEYVELLELLNALTSDYDCTREPYASLFDLLASFAAGWEAEHDPDLKDPEVPAHEVLAYLMEERSVSQHQLAQAGLADQGNLSRVLAGKRSISKMLAKRLGEYFGVSPASFI